MSSGTRLHYLVSIALAIFIVACKEPLPDSLQALIDSDTESEIQAIWRFRFNGETVYYAQSGCCDMFNNLYDDDGKFICSPDGGFSGHGDGKCPTFWDQATDRKAIWKR